MKNNTTDLVLATLAADSFTLGAHWIYTPEDIENAKLDWMGLNKPLAQWHEGKAKGDFTHYGDQIVCLYEYIKEYDEYDTTNYINTWKTYMKTYSGYIDNASSSTIENLKSKQSIPYGSNSDDFSVVGRIAPLLAVSTDEKTFLNNVRLFVSSTHNNEEVLEVADFFATLLWNLEEGSSIKESIKRLTPKYSKRLQNYIKEAVQNSKDTTDAIVEFGSACSTNGAFQASIYLLNKFENDFENAMIENAKAGGDSSARAMVYTMLMVRVYGKTIIPSNWIEQMKYKI